MGYKYADQLKYLRWYRVFENDKYIGTLGENVTAKYISEKMRETENKYVFEFRDNKGLLISRIGEA